MNAQALWYVAPGEVALRPASLAADAAFVTVRALYSGLSRGTERLVLNGRVPSSEFARMRCPFQEGTFPFPVKYGYALVGEVLDGADAGRTVFLLHPHQSLLRVPAAALHPVPADVPARRAVLAANMETAVTVAWDAGIGVGDSVLVVGAGVLGLLVAALAARVPGTAVTVVDVDPARAGIAARAGARFAAADSAPREQDVVIHTSGASAGLALALAAAGDEATVVEASWYGDAAVSLALGEAFHARRLKLVSSQVGRIPPGRAPRWSHRRRIAAALDLLRDPLFESFVTATIDFADAPAHVPAALAPGSSGLMTVLRYAV